MVTMRYVHPNEEDERAVVETLIKKFPEIIPTGFRDIVPARLNNTQASEII
jgi:hypothetical protein